MIEYIAAVTRMSSNTRTASENVGVNGGLAVLRVHPKGVRHVLLIPGVYAPADEVLQNASVPKFGLSWLSILRSLIRRTTKPDFLNARHGWRV
jgi:hypothetical protein